MSPLVPLQQLKLERVETPAVLKQLNAASRQLAELKGVAASIPNQGILINTLALQEAKDSSAIESIVTTHDELFAADALPSHIPSPAIKEVARYRQALRIGYLKVTKDGLLTNRVILQIQQDLVKNNAGLRTQIGTTLKDPQGRVIYTPPPPNELPKLLADLERFINDDTAMMTDPLIKMALIHFQFESIHPFYDGNGRTGRIINVLYLVKQRLLNIPVLYLSRHILRTKPDYYRLLQAVRTEQAWEAWTLYMLKAVEQVAMESIQTITRIRKLMLDTKHRIRSQHPAIYSQDLINTIFTHPYTKITHVMRELDTSRPTANKYLDTLVNSGILTKRKIGTTNHYINQPLYEILAGSNMQDE